MGQKAEPRHVFTLRLPEPMYRRLEAEATVARRSVNSEIAFRLERSFQADLAERWPER